jgi:hypothetical protein
MEMGTNSGKGSPGFGLWTWLPAVVLSSISSTSKLPSSIFLSIIIIAYTEALH